MNTETINKIGILLSWPRELDMFSVFTKNITDNIVIVIDDFIYTENERTGNVSNIIALLDSKIDYVLLSRVLSNKSKYKILLSTAQTFQEKVTFRSYSKYIYAVLIGNFIYHSGLSKFFIKIIGRPLTGGGKYANKFERYQIEKAIGDKVIRYPKGLDVSKAVYPVKRWEGVFDIHLCHGNIDRDLITNKFSNARCVKIGYPKYDHVPSVRHAKNIIYNEMGGIDPVKPLLLWMPTHIKFQSESLDNIRTWLPIIEKLLDKYNILIRPHPKSISVNPEIVNDLRELGFIVDTKRDRKLSILYQSADLVLADYGGSVLSTIYMKKKLILLNMPNNTKFAHWREKGMYVDNDVRRSVDTFDINNGADLIEQIKNNIQDNDNRKANRLKKQYFGNECDCENISEISNKLKKELHN
jgi:hypothetical protein